jgi:hypothetical protein
MSCRPRAQATGFPSLVRILLDLPDGHGPHAFGAGVVRRRGQIASRRSSIFTRDFNDETDFKSLLEK